MTEPPKAVLLSYVSPATEVARRIREALTATGIEVWFAKASCGAGTPRNCRSGGKRMQYFLLQIQSSF